MSRYASVVWDWNGTLLDDVELALGIVNELLADHGVPVLSRERYLEIFDFPVRDYYARAGLALGDAEFARLSERFCARFDEGLHRAPLFEGVRGALATFRGRGLRQFLLSGTEHEALQRMLGHYGLAGAFEWAQGMRDTLAEGKVGGGEALLARRAIDRRRTVLVGDTLHDAEVAEALGVDCLLVATGHQARARLEARGWPVLDSLEEVVARLERS